MGCMQSVPIEEPSVPDTAAVPAPEAPAVTVPAATDDDPPTELVRRRVFATSPKPLPSLEKKSQMLATAYSPRGATDLWEDGTIASVRIPRESLHVRRMIGSGTFTEVYLASYKSWLVALKMLVPERRRSEAHVNTLLAGAKLMATIGHPYIVWLMGVAWDSPTDLCLVSEYMEGGNLRTLLDSYAAGGRPVGFNRQKVTIALHVAYALTYLHSLKPPVLRRDLDSSKILLTAALEAKLAACSGLSESMHQTTGTDFKRDIWRAPEVLLGDRYDASVDVFSFGVMLSELDTHVLPYSHAMEQNTGTSRNTSDIAMRQMIATGSVHVEFSAAGPPVLTALGEACVSINPKERPTAAEVLSKLQEILALELQKVNTEESKVGAA